MENPTETDQGEVSGASRTKICSICKQSCDVALFHRNSSSPDGLDSRCAPCKADRKRLQLYDLPPHEYKQLLFLQNCECAICRRGLPDLDHGLVVDHNHATGKVRALLCRDCNLLISYAHEDLNILERAKQYLEVYNVEW